MREILFRGKREDNGEWVYGDLIHRINWSSDCAFIRIQDSGFDNYEEYEVIPETIGQYTGLTDKNGVKIFEGDIVRINRNISHSESKVTIEIEIGVARFNEDSLEYSVSNVNGSIKGYCSNYGLSLWRFKNDTNEVIGNIHDNPGLLEVSE